MQMPCSAWVNSNWLSPTTTRALKLRPKWPEALMNRGVALQALNRPDDALASYERALAIRPTFAPALSNRGNALCSLGRFQQALMSYDQALVLQPEYPEALQNRGTALQALGRHAEALKASIASLPSVRTLLTCTPRGAVRCWRCGARPKRWKAASARWRSAQITPRR